MKVILTHRKMLERRLRWCGHVIRRKESRFTKAVMCVDIAEKRPGERPKMRWMDMLKSDLKELSIFAEDTLDRSKWKLITRKEDLARVRLIRERRRITSGFC